MEKNIIYHNYNVAAIRDPRIASVLEQMFGIYCRNVFVCYTVIG